mgnify:CR=1 FL=1
MQEQFDKRLADKIRQEMEAYEPPYDAGHWADMQKRLGRTPKNYSRWILAACTALFLVTLAYLPLGDATLTTQLRELDQSVVNSRQTEKSNLRSGADSSGFNSQQQMLADVNDEENTRADDTNKELQTASVLKRNSFVNESTDTKDSEIKSKEQLALREKKISETEVEKTSDTTRESIEDKESVNTSAATEEENIATVNTSGNFVTNQEEAANSEDESILRESKSSKIFATDNFATENVILKNKPLYLDSVGKVESSLVPMTMGMSKGIKGLDRFYFSILAEGFLNQNNRVNNYREVGFGLGFTANYSLSEKIVIASGFIFKQMHGKAFPDQSRFGQQDEASFSTAAFPGFSANSINSFVESTQEMTDLVTTTAHLSAIEIPIQLNYYISTNVNRRFYIGAAASSYFYLSERYEYEKEKFQLPTQSNIRKLSIVNEEVTYGAFEHIDLFSTITLSVGMEKAVGLHSSVGIEPFWSIPILSMGQENIPINSTGLRLRYNFGR